MAGGEKVFSNLLLNVKDKVMVLLIAMHGCESWSIRKAEQGTMMPLNCGAGELFRVPSTARRTNWKHDTKVKV